MQSIRTTIVTAVLIAAVCLTSGSFARPESSGKVSSNLILALEDTDGPVDILVSFSQIPSSIYHTSIKDASASRGNRIAALVTALKRHGSGSQGSEVLPFLQESGLRYRVLWIANKIWVQGASKEVIEKLKSFSSVVEIGLDEHIPMGDIGEGIQPPRVLLNNTAKAITSWGIEMVEAHEANARLQEAYASGLSNPTEVRVGVIDTGCRVGHEAIRSGFMGTYGWYDPYYGEQEAYDDAGHGTHVAGTIAGSEGIGVFPNAKYMCCKGCSATSCPSSALYDCGQFTLCPTLPDGTAEDCSYAPHVVSNSWNGGQGSTWFDPVIEAWHSVNIIPVFSAGNSGPFCNTALSPADRDVISVGATTNVDSAAYFSSAGPAIDGTGKPDIAAPGMDVVSAWHTSDTAYATASGTSMAAPHVSGLVALFKAFDPEINYDDVKYFLVDGANREGLFESGRDCGGISEGVFPNNIYGHGRINALRSLESLIASRPRTTTTTTTTTEEPIITTEPDPETEAPTTAEPEPETEEPEPETTVAPPTPGPCYHGKFWQPDAENVPNLMCICQRGAEGLQYNCYNASEP